MVDLNPAQDRLIWRTEADCARSAQLLAQQVRQCVEHAATLGPALPSLVVELHGTLGAGKTTWVRHLLRALGVAGRIKSPTYTVMEPYELATPLGPWPMLHLDCYRFSDPREWLDAGLRDAFAQPGLKLVEWPDLARSVLPVPDLELHITPGTAPQTEEARQVHAVAHSAAGRAAWAAMRGGPAT